MVKTDDVISRCIIFEKAFKSGIHVDSVLFVFSGSSDDGAAHESGVLRRLAPRDEDVRRIGCAIARRQNERNGNPASGPLRRYYCGFRNALAAELPTLGDGYTVSYTLREEGGEPSHVDIALSVSVTGKNARNTVKTEAGLALAEVFGPPTEQICEEDGCDLYHPLLRDPFCLRRDFPEFGIQGPILIQGSGDT